MSTYYHTDTFYSNPENIKKIQELKSRYPRRMALVADAHTLSRFAITVPNFITDEGNLLAINQGQEILYSYWVDFCNLVNEWECDTVLVGSDMVHGQNYKDRGSGLMTTQMNEQQRGLEMLMRPLCNHRKHIWVSGSGYHNSLQGMKVERGTCEALGGNWQGAIANISVDPFGKTINLTHGGSGAFIYRETATAREILYGKVAQADGKLPHFDIYIHGHWHWYYVGEYENEIFIQLPCWIVYEPITIFTPKYTRFQPSIGGVILLFDETGEISIKKYIYPLIHIADAVVEI